MSYFNFQEFLRVEETPHLTCSFRSSLAMYRHQNCTWTLYNCSNFSLINRVRVVKDLDICDKLCNWWYLLYLLCSFLLVLYPVYIVQFLKHCYSSFGIFFVLLIKISVLKIVYNDLIISTCDYTLFTFQRMLSNVYDRVKQKIPHYCNKGHIILKIKYLQLEL